MAEDFMAEDFMAAAQGTMAAQPGMAAARLGAVTATRGAAAATAAGADGRDRADIGGAPAELSRREQRLDSSPPRARRPGPARPLGPAFAGTTETPAARTASGMHAPNLASSPAPVRERSVARGERATT